MKRLDLSYTPIFYYSSALETALRKEIESWTIYKNLIKRTMKETDKFLDRIEKEPVKEYIESKRNEIKDTSEDNRKRPLVPEACITLGGKKYYINREDWEAQQEWMKRRDMGQIEIFAPKIESKIINYEDCLVLKIDEDGYLTDKEFFNYYKLGLDEGPLHLGRVVIANPSNEDKLMFKLRELLREADSL